MAAEEHKKFLKIGGTEDIHYSVIYDGLPSVFQTVAEKELKETENARIEGMQHLKAFMYDKQLPHMPEDLILAVLRHSKYNIKKAESKLKSFTLSRQEIIRRLKELGMEKIQAIVDDIAFGALPYRDKKGRIITCSIPDCYNLECYNTHNVLTVVWAHLLFFLSFPITPISGFVYYAQCKTPSITLFISILQSLRRDFRFLTSFPIRIARVEVLNENFPARCFLRFVRAVLSKKVVGRISFHGEEFSYLHEIDPPDILPEDFGGCLGPLSNDTYKQPLMEFIKELMKENAT